MQQFIQFMRGRYGFDTLSVGLLFLSVVLNLVGLGFNVFSPEGTTDTVFSGIALVPLVICVMRMLSKNIAMREKENRLFIKMIMPLFNRQNNKTNPRAVDEKKIFKFFKCPSCGQKVRVPRGKGKIEILCPKCGNRFIKKT